MEPKSEAPETPDPAPKSDPIASAQTPPVKDATPAKKPDAPIHPDTVGRQDSPEINALVEQTKALNARLEAADKARGEAESKAARAVAATELETTLTELGYTDDAEQRANLRDLVSLRTHIVDGKQVWRGDDGKDYPIKHGLTEFQKGRGKYFVKAASRQAPSGKVLQGEGGAPARRDPNAKVTFKSLARDLKIAR